MNFPGLNPPWNLFSRYILSQASQSNLSKRMTQDQIGDKLDATSFPYVKDAPMATPLSPRSPPPQTTSLRSQKPAWHRAPKATTVENRQRILVFVAGGITYSEMREVYNLANSLHKDIFIGEICDGRTKNEYQLIWHFRLNARCHSQGICRWSQSPWPWRCRL